MKKFIIVLFTALVAFVSCDLFSADEPTDAKSYTYYFKTTEASESTLRLLFDATDDNGFDAENDYSVMQIASKIPADIPYEIYKNGKLIASDKDITQATAGSDDSNGHFSLGIRSLGTNYSTYAGFYASTSPAWANPWDVTKAEGALGEPLTSLWIANNYWSGGDTQDNAKMTRQWYCNTSDLNSDCGIRSYYSVLYFGGRKHESVADLIWTSIASWDAQYGRDKFETYGCPPELGRTTIGGIRLVSGDSNPATTIVDPEGITWKKVGVYFDGEVDTVDDKYYPSENWKGELNRGAKGDYLWLYYTTESSKTGRKLMITNPLFMKYYSTIVNNGGSYAIAEGCLGTLLTWTSGTWCVHTNEILNDLADQVAESSPTLAKAFRPGSTQRVDFIQLYDKDMKPYVYKGVTDYPANFNRNARGDDEIFISYNFITPDDAEWSKF